MPKPEDNLIGRTLEKCRILSKLGTGGMGSVYLAEHFGLGRRVAVKILPPEMSRDPEYVARFMREATTAGRMEHPNIVQIHDVGYAEGRHFIVMQYVDGESLSTVVEELGAMDPRDAARVAVGILRGLHHAHEQGVVHRDVKPDNVLLTKGDEPKLLDFGLAIEQEASLHLTRDGMVVGTPYYLSPEQARGQKATPRSDIYAAGVTLYYLLTGKRPFTGTTALAVLNKHIHEPPVPPMAHNPKIPKPLNDIVLKMMAKRPEDRYPTAGAAADDLERFLSGREVRVRLPWRLPYLSPRARWAAGAGAGALALAAVLALTLSGGGPPPPPPPALAAAPPTPALLESPELKRVLTFDREHRDDVDAYERILTEYDTFIASSADPTFVERARKARAEFEAFMERRAEEELARLPASADPVERRRALESFPRPLLGRTAAGRRAAEELARLPALVRRKFEEDERRAYRLLDEGAFREARTLLESMRDYAGEDQRRRAEELLADLPRREREFKDPLVHTYAEARRRFEEFLLKRRAGPAYREVAEFLRAPRTPAERDRLRVEGFPYDRFLALAPEPDLPYEVLTDARADLTRLLRASGETLAHRLLADLLDALDLEWLLRRVALGLRALRDSGREVTLATFGTAGRIDFGPQGYTFRAKGAPARPLAIAELRPEDLVLLAAASQDRTPEEACAGDAGFARAAAAALLYSAAPDRLPRALRWLEQGARLDPEAASPRLPRLRAEGRRQAREGLAAARAEAARGKLDEARRAAAALEDAWAHDLEIHEEAACASAEILTLLLERAHEARDAGRVKQYARELRERHPGRYDEAVVLRLYGQALRNTGFWDFLAVDPAGEAWTWDGKAKGGPAPARLEGAELCLAAGRSIAPSPARARGASGLSAQVRVVEPAGAGLRFGAFRFVLAGASRVELLEEGEETPRPVRSFPLDRPRGPGDWTELALVAEGGEVVGYVDGVPVFILPGAAPGEGTIALVTDAEAAFRQVRLRK
jgi:predicted Ser/Thr protein kinase